MNAEDIVMLLFALLLGVIIGINLPVPKNSKRSLWEEGYVSAYEDNFGKGEGSLIAKCKLDGGKPLVESRRVICLKEMK